MNTIVLHVPTYLYESCMYNDSMGAGSCIILTTCIAQHRCDLLLGIYMYICTRTSLTSSLVKELHVLMEVFSAERIHAVYT